MPEASRRASAASHRRARRARAWRAARGEPRPALLVARACSLSRPLLPDAAGLTPHIPSSSPGGSRLPPHPPRLRPGRTGADGPRVRRTRRRRPDGWRGRPPPLAPPTSEAVRSALPSVSVTHRRARGRGVRGRATATSVGRCEPSGSSCAGADLDALQERRDRQLLVVAGARAPGDAGKDCAPPGIPLALPSLRGGRKCTVHASLLSV